MPRVPPSSSTRTVSNNRNAPCMTLPAFISAPIDNHRHPEAPERSEGLEGCTATQVGCCRLGQFELPISGKLEIGGRRPSRLASRAPQDDGGRVLHQNPMAQPSLRGSEPPISMPRCQSIWTACPPPSGDGRVRTW